MKYFDKSRLRNLNLFTDLVATAQKTFFTDLYY